MEYGVSDAKQDTIVAIATAQGRAAIGIVRLSGPMSLSITKQLCSLSLRERYAHFCRFHDKNGGIMDDGITIYFRGPNSFTGEDIVELQSHGSPQALIAIQNRCVELGARLAKPGEFSERAFLNGKIDLTQAEAIADIIDAQSQESLKNANEVLQGKFKQEITKALEQLIELRVYVEGSLDFVEEEIDFLDNDGLEIQFQNILTILNNILKEVKQSALLNHGMSVVITGEPNVGKSTLLNQLVDKEAAIVTDVAGTTRDKIEQTMLIDGIPILLVDTAGIRATEDIVEKQGIERAKEAIEQADVIIKLFDASKANKSMPTDDPFEADKIVIRVFNKIDLVEQLQMDEQDIGISAKNQIGVEKIVNKLSAIIKSRDSIEMSAIAKSRHVNAIARTLRYINSAHDNLRETKAADLIAEELLMAQNTLGEITGDYLPDDLLGDIFSRFCIGK